ncbi:TetR/AcrR family transcriptional regulator [Nocardia terpenica]|uniref:TetR/AcrR family transcriptional regulator n=1 Tax=Nocardia terpenica TaxID=455432 RepID=UPI001E65156A|nr:TetR/AcrR family transcriptional regulator [Nocardia terpenica]
MSEKRTPPTGERRVLRADARRNRERVLAAAREAFAAEGISVPLDEIARRAGVGPGTVYRHFPTKEALFHAAIVDGIERMTEHARTLAETDDPGAAFFGFLDHMVTEGAVKRDLAEALGGAQNLEISAPTKQLHDEIDALLRHAQRSGAVRPDIDSDDLLLLLKGAFLATHAPAATPEQRKRTFAVVFDGLRAR